MGLEPVRTSSKGGLRPGDDQDAQRVQKGRKLHKATNSCMHMLGFPRTSWDLLESYESLREARICKNRIKSKRKCNIRSRSSQIQPKPNPTEIQPKSRQILRKASQTHAKEPKAKPASLETEGPAPRVCDAAHRGALSHIPRWKRRRTCLGPRKSEVLGVTVKS